MERLGTEVSKLSNDLYILSFDPRAYGCNHRNVVKYLEYLSRSLSPAIVVAVPVGMSLSKCSPIVMSDLKDYIHNLYRSIGEVGTEVNDDIARSFEE